MKQSLYLFLFVFTFSNSAIANNTINQQNLIRNKGCSWVPLFKNIQDTVNWKSNKTGVFPKEGWRVNGNELILMSGKKGGDLYTRSQYRNFELKLEFNMTELVNSGVKYFVSKISNASKGKLEWIGFEYQIIDDFNHERIRAYEGPKGSTGALYLVVAPGKSKKLYPVGKWNSMKIKVQGKHIQHWLNGKKVVDVMIDSPEFNSLVQETKFKDYPEFGKKEVGFLLLQDHGCEIRFRNILIKELK